MEKRTLKESSLSHVDASNNVAMVDISDKLVTKRTAVAQSIVILGKEIMSQLTGNEIQTKKGPVFQTAIIAGTMAAKKTWELIPLCHPLALENCKISIDMNDMAEVLIQCTATITSKTGVEMEALTGASVAALTIYDMCKAISHNIIIKETKLISKTGEKVTSSITGKHEKHIKLARAAFGEWGRNEFAITGTDDSTIRQIAQAAVDYLPQYKIAFVDTGCDDEYTGQTDIPAIYYKPFLSYINRLSYIRLDITKQPAAFQKRALFNDCDLILVNGNHFKASKQIVVVDEKMPLEKRLDELTDVHLIILKDSVTSIPAYITRETAKGCVVSEVPLADKESLLQNIKHLILKHGFPMNGLVLSGGNSRRMGTDKGELRYHQKTQREHIYSLLKEICVETYISCNEEQAQHMHDLPVIKDTFLGLGPLGGILSAFQSNPNAAWFTVACDLPFLQKSDLYRLMTAQNNSKTATAYLDTEGKFPEPLVTIWEPKSYPVLLQFMAQGYNCPRKILMNIDVEMVPAMNGMACKNVNTKEEYEEAMFLLQGQA